MNSFHIFMSFFFLCSCVSIEQNMVETRQSPQVFFKDPSCEVKTRETAHFLVKACDFQTAEYYAALAERFYDKIIQDTNLYSFTPKKSYEIKVYSDKSEYISMSKAQSYSKGFTAENMILTYPSSSIAAIMAYEITHLILNEFMGDYSSSNLFVSEGLAVYQERQASFETDRYYRELIDRYLKPSPIPFIEMLSFRPVNNDKSDYISKWYAQCSSVVEYLMRREGSFRFSIFLKNIKKGYNIDLALKDAYPGIFENYIDLEKKWRSWI